MAKKKNKSNSHSKILLDYPSWICTECAEKSGGIWSAGHIGTYHDDICDVCNKWISVTELSEWGYPKVERKEDITLILQEIRSAYLKMMQGGQKKDAEYLEELIDYYQIKLERKKMRRNHEVSTSKT